MKSKQSKSKDAHKRPKSQTEITETGWAILNTGILVFPSIMPQRKDAQDRYAASSGGWPAMKKTGMYKSVPVRITYKP